MKKPLLKYSGFRPSPVTKKPEKTPKKAFTEEEKAAYQVEKAAKKAERRKVRRIEKLKQLSKSERKDLESDRTRARRESDSPEEPVFRAGCLGRLYNVDDTLVFSATNLSHALPVTLDISGSIEGVWYAEVEYTRAYPHGRITSLVRS